MPQIDLDTDEWEAVKAALTTEVSVDNGSASDALDRAARKFGLDPDVIRSGVEQW